MSKATVQVHRRLIDVETIPVQVYRAKADPTVRLTIRTVDEDGVAQGHDLIVPIELTRDDAWLVADLLRSMS